MFKLFNRNEKYLHDLYPLSAINKETLNGEDTLTLTLAGDIDIGKKYRLLAKVGSDWKEFIVEEIEEDRTEGTKEIYAENSIYELMGDFIEDKRAINQPASVALKRAIETTRWEIGRVDYFGVASATFYRTNALEAIREICTTWGGELNTRIVITGNEITARLIDILEERGSFLGERFVTGENIGKITRTVHTDQIVTALYGYGKGEEVGEGHGRRIDFAEVNGGISYVEDDEARLLWGRLNGTQKAHIFGKIEFDDVEDKEELLSLTRSKLEELSKPKVTYEGEIVGAESHLGDTVVIIDETFTPKLRLTSRIYEIERDLIDETQTKPILGNYIDRLSKTNVENKKYIDNFRSKSGVWDRSEIIGSDGTINAQYLDNLIDELNQRMNSQGGYVFISDDGQGLITYDAPNAEDATMAIQLLGGGFRIANSKLANGNWDWRTFGDGNGFVADSIISGMLKGGQVEFDLTNGTLQIGSANNPHLYWDGTNLFVNGDNINLESNIQFQSKVSADYVDGKITTEIAPLASRAYVDEAVDAINRANPNLVSNNPEKWEQGNILSGSLTESTNHIRTAGFYPIRAGQVTVKVLPEYQAKLVRYDMNYNFLDESTFSTEQTFTLATNSVFKMVLKPIGVGTLGVDEVSNSELKAENAEEATQWTPYFGDLTLDEQAEFFNLKISSTNGWTVNTNDFTTQLKAELFLFNDNISQRYADSNITWYRKYPDSPRAIIGNGLTYNVTAAETMKSATYEVVFDIPIRNYYLVDKTGNFITTKAGEKIMVRVTSENTALEVSESKVLVRDVTDRLVSAESEISQLATEITQTVKQTTFNSVTNQFETDIGSLSTRATSVEATLNGARHTFTQTGYEFRNADNKVMFSLSKGLANEQNISKYDDCESGYPLIIPINIGSSTGDIEQVIVKWRNGKFRSTSKSAASGGGATSGASSSTTTASGGTTTTASGGATTSGSSSSSSSSYSVPANFIGTSSPIGGSSDHYHSIGAASFGHSHTIYHTHSIGSHTHSIGTHTHSMGHTHSTPAHTHNLVFGVFEEASVGANTLNFYVNGVSRGSKDASQGEIDLTPYIQTTGWHTIEIRTPNRKRIDASVFIKSYIRR